jgi:5'-methylthioadenosine phosphorylase
MTGPSFETEAEAKMIAKLGGDIVGTSVVSEVKLAREMSVCYQAVVLITRYEEFSADIEKFEKGVAHVKSLDEDVVKLIMGIIAYIPRMKTCHCWEK